MRNRKKIGLCAIGCVMFFSVQAADSTAVFIQRILYPPQADMRTHAIKRLTALKQASAFPFLEAIHNRALYVFGALAITVENGKSEGESFRAYELYPVYRMLTAADGKPLRLHSSEIKSVEINRADRLHFLPIVPWLNIFNPDRGKRAMAYGQLPITADTSLLHILSSALKKETDREALRAGKEARFAMLLNRAKDVAEAKSLADSISVNDGDNAAGVLTAYAAQTNLPSLRLYARQKVAALESHYAFLQRMQNLFSGLSLGSILILISLGLAIVYGLAGIINMAHGEFLMIGAYAAYCMELLFDNVLQIQNTDLFYLAALPVSFMAAGVIGLVLERLVIRRLYSKPLESLLATWGVSLILIQLARTLFGDLTAVKLPRFLAGGWQIAPHLVLPYNRLFVIALAVISVSLIYWTLFRTRLGLQIRAVTQNRNMSACLGVDTRRIDAITFFIGSGLAGLAGCAMTLIGNVVPDMGQTYIVDSFMIVVAGGVGKLAGTIAAGLGIGVFSKVLESFFEAVYGKVLILMGIMIFMQFKPKGLFPDKSRSAED